MCRRLRESVWLNDYRYLQHCLIFINLITPIALKTFGHVMNVKQVKQRKLNSLISKVRQNCCKLREKNVGPADGMLPD